ncbi:PREDICTED: WD repeat-containing protein 48 homolog [Erythranthe guttata]|uniref:WD repeat-containing protein 48 homolog n=1 Tax=Erythranthe guttata TaxID=4155 RepID=UPI00064DE6F6|nr:PREDICTED: WD repeat-containing protein 48 homolog [Erythranthe guttata]|eukprot:XP_012855537.1 PREDICTED: WD repeat-containing protein 48 homolog [Erythranthe guttata]
MEEVQTSSSGTVSHETHSAPTLCEFNTSFNSLQSNAATKSTPAAGPPNYYPASCSFIASLNTTTSQIISCLAVQNDDNYYNLLYAASTEEVNVFDITTLSLLDTFGSGYSGSVKSIAFSKGRIFTAHQDCRIRVWQKVMTSSSSSSYSRSKQIMKHHLIQTLPTFKDRFFNRLSPKNYVRIRRNEHKLRIEHADAVSALTVNNDVGLMYSVSWDKSFKIWNVSSPDMPCLDSVNEAHADAVNAVAVDPTGGTVYTGSANGEIKVWKVSKETKKHMLLTTLSKHASSVNALALTMEGSILCSGGGDRVILVWERGHNGAILSLVCVDNGVVISGSSDKSVVMMVFLFLVEAWMEKSGPGKLWFLIVIPGGDN